MESGDASSGASQRARVRRRDRVVSEPLRLADLPPSDRRRAIFRCGATVVLCWVFLIGAFYVLPVGHESSLRAGVRVGVDVALIGAVFAWQIRRISVAALPELRAIEALGIVIVLFLVLFSSIYLAMSHESLLAFTQRLNQTRALYFTVTVFSTVGFGDITPRTDPARLVVATQMLLDLAIIGAAVRVIFSAARSRITPTGAGADS